MSIIVFILLCIFSLFSLFLPVKKQKFFLPLSAVFLIIVAGFRTGDKMPDYQTYVGLYNQIISGNFSYFIEISFVYLVQFANFVWKDKAGVLIFFYAFLGIGIKLFSFNKLSKLYFLSVVIYISNYFILHEMIQIRAGVATGFILVSIQPLFERNKNQFFIFIFLATFFHYSSCCFFLLWFLKPKSFNKAFYLCLIPFGYIIHFTKIDPITIILKFLPLDILTVKTDYIDKNRAEDLAISVFSFFVLTRLIIVLYFSLFQQQIQKYNQYFTLLLKLYILGIFIYVAFADYPEIAVRFCYTLMATEIIIIPTLIYTIKGQLFPQLIVIAYAFLSFFANVYFTTYFNWQ
jgi:hypothetical protein